MQCDKEAHNSCREKPFWGEERGLDIQVAATRSTRAAMLIINARCKGGPKDAEWTKRTREAFPPGRLTMGWVLLVRVGVMVVVGCVLCRIESGDSFIRGRERKTESYE